MRNRNLTPILSAEDIAFTKSLVLHEDNDIIVLNKPSGLAVQSGRGIEQSLDDLLAVFSKSNGKRPRLVHRIDRGTSGLLVVARTKPAASHLSNEFARRRVKKTYLAIVEGVIPAANADTIDLALAKVQEIGRARMIVAKPGRADSQDASTHWVVRGRSERHALLEVHPRTGRMHQIRVHLSAAGCPIIGDALYGFGASDGPLMLHAWRIAFKHPNGGDASFVAPMPHTFAEFGYQAPGL